MQSGRWNRRSEQKLRGQAWKDDSIGRIADLTPVHEASRSRWDENSEHRWIFLVWFRAPAWSRRSNNQDWARIDCALRMGRHGRDRDWWWMNGWSMAAKKAKRKKAAKKKSSWGGARPGAGRPKGSGQGPSPNSRRNRVAVMLRDKELRDLRALARKRGVPVSTVAYDLIAKGLPKR